MDDGAGASASGSAGGLKRRADDAAAPSADDAGGAPALKQHRLVEAPRESVISELRSRLVRLKQRAIRGKVDDVKADAERRLAGLEEAIKPKGGGRARGGEKAAESAGTAA